jgi:uncharacterized glyoxalase superfamily protein PhnB
MPEAKSNFIPAGYHTVTPYLTVSNVAKLMEFMRSAFNATELHKMSGPDGRVAHAEMKIGDSIIMMGQPQNDSGVRRTMLYLYVPDCDAMYRQAIAAGGTSVREPINMFYGDRSGAVTDPAGNEWWIATHVEDVAPDEMERRMMAVRG